MALNFFVAEVEASTPEGVRQTYFPADFAQFAPRSAVDLVKHIPGFSMDEAQGNRGLGQADASVLINGRRILGKSNDPTQAFRRLSRDSVIRLEILDGASLNIGRQPGISGDCRVKS